MATLTDTPRVTTAARRLLPVIRVASGNFVEMYDFLLFGFYATNIARTFFPSNSEYASLMLTFTTFAAGFLMRPVGALLLGAYIDRAGRRKGLLLSLALMACGSVLLAATPGYSTIGAAAPLLVLVGRLLQGLSAGAEVGGVSVYLAEIAPLGRRGAYVSWQSASQQAAVMAAAAIGYVINAHYVRADIEAWAWRIPFLVGCAILPVLLYLRRGLEETQEFAARRTRPPVREVLVATAQAWRVVLTGALLVVMTTVSFYLITLYTPTFGRTVLKLSPTDALMVTFCVGLSNFVWLPIAGALSDRIGRAPLMAAFSGLTLLTAYPALWWLVSSPSFGRMLGVELWLAWLYACYNGAALPALAERMPPAVRAVGFSLAYSLATAVFGGFTPLISTWLIEQSGDKAAPGLWLATAACCGLAATWALARIEGAPHSERT